MVLFGCPCLFLVSSMCEPSGRLLSTLECGRDTSMVILDRAICDELQDELGAEHQGAGHHDVRKASRCE